MRHISLNESTILNSIESNGIPIDIEKDYRGPFSEYFGQNRNSFRKKNAYKL
jgi:hypothetical protein